MQVLKVTLMIIMALTLKAIGAEARYLFPGPAVMLPFLLSSTRTFPCVTGGCPFIVHSM